MCPRRRDHAPGPTAASEVSERLRASILDGDLPPGTALREEDLADRFAVSRHTVRAALARLSAERLVQSIPYRGSRVAQLDIDGLHALQDLRGALEGEAVRLLRERHGEQWPAAVTAPIRAALTVLDHAERTAGWAQTTRAHSEFHQALVAAAGSPRITEAYAQLDSEILVLLTHMRPDYPPGSLAPEHRTYLEAAQRDGGPAVHAHLAHSTALIEASLREHGSTD